MTPLDDIWATEAAIGILAQAATQVDRRQLSAVQTLLDAIYYLRTGQCPVRREAREAA